MLPHVVFHLKVFGSCQSNLVLLFWDQFLSLAHWCIHGVHLARGSTKLIACHVHHVLHHLVQHRLEALLVRQEHLHVLGVLNYLSFGDVHPRPPGTFILALGSTVRPLELLLLLL